MALEKLCPTHPIEQIVITSFFSYHHRIECVILISRGRELTYLASPAIYGRVLAKALSHVTIMPVLLRPVNNFLGQVIGNASEGKYNTMNNSSSGEVTFQKCLKLGITLCSSKNSNKSQTFATGAYQRLHETRPRRVVWLWEPE